MDDDTKNSAQENMKRTLKNHQNLPNAYSSLNQIQDKLRNNPVALFLDYDGTLTPVVAHPQEAMLSQTTRNVLSRLAEKTPVAIISGRDKENVEKLVNLTNIIYVGNHGLDLESPEETALKYEEIDNISTHLLEIYNELYSQLNIFHGIILELKKFSLVVHYRNVPIQMAQKTIHIALAIAQKYPELKIQNGKKILEFVPNINWDKGAALHYLIDRLDLVKSDACFVYIGDDITDENAFRVLPESSLGILVGTHGEQTYADFHLEDPFQVEKFLSRLVHLLD